MQCDDCWYNNYDEEMDVYYCSQHFDEDEWARIAAKDCSCPYYRSGSEYDLSRRQ